MYSTPNIIANLGIDGTFQQQERRQTRRRSGEYQMNSDPFKQIMPYVGVQVTISAAWFAVTQEMAERLLDYEDGKWKTEVLTKYLTELVLGCREVLSTVQEKEGGQ